MVPDVTLLNILDAQEKLKNAKLGEGAVNFVVDDSPKDTVISQSVAQGEKKPVGTIINLQVSQGPVEEPEENDPPEPPVEPVVPVDPLPGEGDVELKEKTISVPLPEREGEVLVSVFLDGVIHGDPYLVDPESPSVDIKVMGHGHQSVTVWMDRTTEVYSNVINFDQ